MFRSDDCNMFVDLFLECGVFLVSIGRPLPMKIEGASAFKNKSTRKLQGTDRNGSKILKMTGCQYYRFIS